MSWNGVQKWLDNADLPFKHVFRSASDELNFSEVYPHFFDYIFRLCRNFVIIDDVPDSVYYPFAIATLIINGKLCFFKRDSEDGGELAALNCAQAAQPDLYYVPEDVLVVNPRLKKSYNLKNGEECEVVYCTSQDMYRYGVQTGGLYSLIDITARLLTDNLISINCAQRNMRCTTGFAADDEITVQSIEAVLKAMYNGAPYKVVQKTLVDKIEQLPLEPNGAQQTLLQLLEAHKYILSDFLAKIGVDEPQQMKRERLVTAEVEQGAELPFINIYDIVESITEGIERVNKHFGTKMSVRVNPYIMQALEGAEENQAETEPDAANDAGEPIQPEAGSVEDIVLPPSEEADAAGITAPADSSETEPETITEAAAEIIEAAAEIIKIEEGGADNAGESDDSREAGEARGSSDSEQP